MAETHEEPDMGDLRVNILVVDSDPEIRERFLQGFDRAGFNTREADSADDAYRILGKADPDVVVIDLESLGREAMALIRFSRQRRCPPEVIVLTGQATVPMAIEAMKLGVFDDLLVPVDLDALTERVRAAAMKRRKQHGNQIRENGLW